MYSDGDYEISYRQWIGFPPWDKLTFRFSGGGVTLFENKHGIELLALVPMCCFRTFLGLRVQLKHRLPVAACIDTFQVPFYNYFSWTKILGTVVYLKIH